MDESVGSKMYLKYGFNIIQCNDSMHTLQKRISFEIISHVFSDTGS